MKGFVEGFEAETYGETFAVDYDRWTLDRGIAAGTASAVAFLGDLVPEAGRALELPRPRRAARHLAQGVYAPA